MYKAVSSEAALFQSDPFITFIFSTGGIILKPYIIKRILSAIPLLLIISFVCFVFINLIPSDPAEVALRVHQVPIITEDAIAEVRSQGWTSLIWSVTLPGYWTVFTVILASVM